MNREVNLNWPMFIAIVISIVAITALLVYGVNSFTELMEKDRESMYNQLQILETNQNVL